MASPTQPWRRWILCVPCPFPGQSCSFLLQHEPIKSFEGANLWCPDFSQSQLLSGGWWWWRNNSGGQIKNQGWQVRLVAQSARGRAGLQRQCLGCWLSFLPFLMFLEDLILEVTHHPLIIKAERWSIVSLDIHPFLNHLVWKIRFLGCLKDKQNCSAIFLLECSFVLVFSWLH